MVSATSSSAFETVVDIPPATSLSGLEPNTQINVREGADLPIVFVPPDLAGIEINISGGQITQRVIAAGAERVNVSGGTVGRSGSFRDPSLEGRSVHITGGEVVYLEATEDLTVEGGRIERAKPRFDATATISGGRIGLLANGTGVATISGGRIGRLQSRSAVLRGSDFRLDGIPVSGSASLDNGAGQPFQTLTGVLEDGTSFVYSRASSDSLNDIELSVVETPVLSTVVDLANDPVPNGLRSGQTLYAGAGDDLGDYFHAYDATIELGAGTLGTNAKLYQTRLTVDGGVVGEGLVLLPGADVDLRSGMAGSFRAGEGSVLRLSGGRIGSIDPFPDESVSVTQGSRIEVSGGELIDILSAYDSTTILQTGGYLRDVRLDESTLRIEGGHTEMVQVVGSEVVMQGGSIATLVRGNVSAYGGRIGTLNSVVPRFHGQVEVDGVPVSSGDVLREGSVVTGVLADGTTFAFSSLLGDDVRFFGVGEADVPAPSPTTINSPTDPVPRGLREGQRLELGTGADTGRYFASLNAHLNITGGTLGDDSVVVGGVTTISDGVIGQRFAAINQAEVIVRGGRLGGVAVAGVRQPRIKVLQDSELTVSGGSVTAGVDLDGTSSLSADAGQMALVRVGVGARVHVSGTASVDAIRDVDPSDYGAPPVSPGDGRTSVLIDGGGVGTVGLPQADVRLVSGTVQSLALEENSTAIVEGGDHRSMFIDDGSTLTFHGGTAQTVTAAGDANGNGRITIHGGQIETIASRTGGEVTLEAGVVTDRLSMTGGTFRMNGGRIEHSGTPFSPPNRVERQSFADLRAGSVAEGFYVTGSMEIRGGVFGRGNQVRGRMQLHGGDFFLNGAPVNGRVALPDEYVLTGTLTDGSPVVLSSVNRDRFEDGGSLWLVNEPIPAGSTATFDVTTPTAPAGLRSGQRLNLFHGGHLDVNFGAVGASIHQSGGSIAKGFEAVDTEMTVSGGSIAESAALLAGSRLDLLAGQIGDSFIAADQTETHVTGGQIGEGARFDRGSRLEVTGGTIGPGARLSGSAKIAGGAWGRGVVFDSQNANIEIRGSGFRLNGQTVTGQLGPALPDGSVLTGVLADGTPFLVGAYDVFRSTPIALIEQPSDGPSPRLINAPFDAVPRGLREGQTLNLGPLAETIRDFTAVGGSLNLIGGTVGERFEAAYAKIDVRRGTISAEAHLYEGTTLTIRGGTVKGELEVASGATLTQIGGALEAIRLRDGAVMHVAGGDFNGQPPDNTVVNWARLGSELHFYGLEFSQGRTDLIGQLAWGESITVLNRERGLMGVLSDGSSLELTTSSRRRRFADGTVTLTKLMQGDFNQDGMVDLADYAVWQGSLGETVVPGEGADHDFDGLITTADIDIWISVVPEPTGISLCLPSIVVATKPRRRPTHFK